MNSMGAPALMGCTPMGSTQIHHCIQVCLLFMQQNETEKQQHQMRHLKGILCILNRGVIAETENDVLAHVSMYHQCTMYV